MKNSKIVKILLFLTIVLLLWLLFAGMEWKKEEVTTAGAVVKKNTVQAKKNEPKTVEIATTDRCTVVAEKNVKKGQKKAWQCPVCGATAEDGDLCNRCGEPYTRLWGYGFTRCWKTADGIEWETETAPACGCMPDEACDFCHDKINHGWKSSGEAKYYEYSDFLKEKGLSMYKAVYPVKPVKKMEETVKVQEVKNDIQDKDGESIQQSPSGKEETGGEAGQLENADICDNNDDCCGIVDNVDDVKEEADEI